MRSSWYKVFKESAAAEPERVVIREGERSVTFAELKALVTVFAGKFNIGIFSRRVAERLLL